MHPARLVSTRQLAVRALAVLLMSLVLGAPTAASADEYSDADTAVALTNDVRAWNGVDPLAYDGYLQSVAQGWAGELARGDYLAHNPDLQSLTSGYWAWGENVGRGPSVAAVHDGLVNSRHHFSNIVGSQYTNIGVGVAYGWDGTVYLVEVFGG